VPKKFGKIQIALFNTCVEGWKEVQARDVSGASVFSPTVPVISGFLRLFKNVPYKIHKKKNKQSKYLSRQSAVKHSPSAKAKHIFLERLWAQSR